MCCFNGCIYICNILHYMIESQPYNNLWIHFHRKLALQY